MYGTLCDGSLLAVDRCMLSLSHQSPSFPNASRPDSHCLTTVRLGLFSRNSDAAVNECRLCRVSDESVWSVSVSSPCKARC